jgi:erythromycin esterase-like protein
LRPPPGKVGFYGLDLYSLHKSMDEVIRYLERVDPMEAGRAKLRYACMDRYGPDPQNYGLLVGSGMSEGCRTEIVRQLQRLREKEVEYLARDGAAAADELFFAQQNARLVKNAEMYYRKMFRSDVSSWNLRDEHMMEMLVEVLAHCDNHHGMAKVVVWAHNSHLGDARATDRTRHGELNLGQLVREAFPHQSRSIGFTTYEGTVTAASGWHAAPEKKKVRPALPGSYEQLFHEVGIPAFSLDLTKASPATKVLKEARLERAIGVVYAPQTERQSHYFKARLVRQFDGVIHLDRTSAVEPLEKSVAWSRTEAPETFPVGL